MAKASKKTKDIVIDKPVFGHYKLPYNVGQTVNMEAKLADELLKSGHGITPAAAKARAEAIAKDKSA